MGWNHIKQVSEKAKQLQELEEQCGVIADRLFDDLGNEDLSRELREIEIKIITLTGESVIDYNYNVLTNS